jgi:hypothetical protein
MYGTRCWKRQFFHIEIKYVYCVPENRSTVYVRDVAHEYIRTLTAMFCIHEAHTQYRPQKCVHTRTTYRKGKKKCKYACGKSHFVFDAHWYMPMSVEWMRMADKVLTACEC